MVFTLFGIILGMPIPLPRRARRGPGGNRVPAPLPFARTGAVVPRRVVGAACDRTSQDRWPFERIRSPRILQPEP